MTDITSTTSQLSNRTRRSVLSQPRSSSKRHRKIGGTLFGLTLLAMLGCLVQSSVEVNASSGDNGGSNHDAKAESAATLTTPVFHVKGTGVTAGDIASTVLAQFVGVNLDRLSDIEIEHLADVYSGRVGDLLADHSPPVQTEETVSEVVAHAKGLFEHILKNAELYQQ